MYSVKLLPKARKQLLRLAREQQERIGLAIDSLQTTPFAGKKLEGKFHGAWAIRVWPYRIVYTIEKGIVTVTVLRIDHRKDVYR